MRFNILGCGVAGSWIAHHLACLGNHEFVLYGGASDRELMRDKGPFRREMPLRNTAAEALKAHIMQVNPTSKVEVHGDFQMEYVETLQGVTVGAMSKISDCTGPGRQLRKAGKSWFTLALPVKGKDVYFGSDPSRLIDDHFAGPTTLSKEQVMVAAAQAVGALLSNLH